MTAPAAAKASFSVGEIPPSGPTTRTISPSAGTAAAVSGSAASGSRTIASAAAEMRRAAADRSACSVTSGNHDRLLCLAASCAAELQRARDRPPRSPRQIATDRCAAHGTMTSAPASVSSSTASSPRSPLGIACRTASRGCGSGSALRAQTVRSSSAGRDVATTHSATRPAPSVMSTRSPGVSRRTVLACLPSGPRSVTRSPASSAVGTTKTGGLSSGRPGYERPLKASRNREKKPC
jgi:hypothetical protein